MRKRIPTLRQTRHRRHERYLNELNKRLDAENETKKLKDELVQLRRDKFTEDAVVVVRRSPDRHSRRGDRWMFQTIVDLKYLEMASYRSHEDSFSGGGMLLRGIQREVTDALEKLYIEVVIEHKKMR